MTHTCASTAHVHHMRVRVYMWFIVKGYRDIVKILVQGYRDDFIVERASLTSDFWITFIARSLRMTDVRMLFRTANIEKRNFPTFENLKLVIQNRSWRAIETNQHDD